MSSAMTPDTGHGSGERSALSVRSLSGEPQTPDQIEAEIELQREQLAETIDALSAKLDVKSQAQARVEEAKRTAQSKVAQVKQTAQSTVGSAQTKVGSGSELRPELLAFGITVVVATALLWWRER
jgi:hypothetical protein